MREGGKRLFGESKIHSENPLITIITVVFNGAKYIEDTIQSVISLSSNYSNIEYIVIDGESNDSTIEIIKRYDNSIEYWSSMPDSGVYDAMNKGWELAKLDSYILYLGAGDLIFSLPTIPEILSSKAICGTVLIGDSVIFKSSLNWRSKLGNTIHHQALLLHKSLSPLPPFNIEYRVFGDFDFNARLLNENTKFLFSDSFASYALPGGLTAEPHLKEALTVVKRNFGLFWAAMSLLYDIYRRLRCKGTGSAVQH